MAKAALWLRHFVLVKQSTDPGWKNIEVILSDSNVPGNKVNDQLHVLLGEGEHKIMDYIRMQRTQPDYNPNLKHVVYGLVRIIPVSIDRKLGC